MSVWNINISDVAAVCLIQKPIVPTELYRAVRDSQLIGMSGYSKEVLILLSKLILYGSMLYNSIREMILIGIVYLEFSRVLTSMNSLPGAACLCYWCRAQHVWQSFCKFYDKFLDDNALWNNLHLKFYVCCFI